MAIYEAYEEDKRSLTLFNSGKIVLRKEQKDAVSKAKKHFGKVKHGIYIPNDKAGKFLWNAKMRFGKTFCALQLAKEMNVQKVLILTHRPIVNEQWHEDFKKIFADVLDDWNFGTKFDTDKDSDFYALDNAAETNGKHYLFFASMQYLRRSILVGGDNDEQLKKDILGTDWDLVVIDEAHEGTQTILGNHVIEALSKKKTKLLHLSGTPFNLYSDFKKNEIFTWDYIQEQEAKRLWPQKHPGERNPYADLPELKIFTYDLSNQFEYFKDEGATFTFTEFFRTWTGKADKGQQMPSPNHKGCFVHEEDVNKFLDKLCEDNDSSNYPFSKEIYQENFHHTLWVVPGVKEARALTRLLSNHDVFSAFEIINVAGEHVGDEEKSNALDKVLNKIGEQPENTYTITISCGRLTTGVTVKPWTAVLYLKGSDMTSAATYMQTIFRVQSPHIMDGKMKSECYVFDFSADRTLKMVAETAKYSSIARNNNIKGNNTLTQEEKDKEQLGQWIKYCPICSLDGGTMSSFDVNSIFRHLEGAYVNRLVLSGFNDNCLYDEEELLKMDPETLRHLGKKLAATSNMQKPKSVSKIDYSLSHLTQKEREELEEAKRNLKKNKKNKKNPYSGMSSEQIEALKKEKERKRKAREEREKRISNIRGIALRIPLMMYGGAETGNIEDPLTVDNFTRRIKDESWEEFMPRGITKKDFNYVKKVFNATRFEEAGKRYRQLAQEADSMHIEDRIERITNIFGCFHNPDKETVLTPWRVVNMHMSSTLGGYCFFNDAFDGPIMKEIYDENGNVVDYFSDNKPRFVDRGEITSNLFQVKDNNVKILEINSKTGLYPLYITYSLYRNRFKEYVYYDLFDERSVEEEQVVWDDIIKNNVYVICNTPMAASITRRTLMGFRDVKNDNIKAEKLVEQATKNQDKLVKKLTSLGYWKRNRSKEEMKFNAVVGNPPYQKMDGGASASSRPVYHHFVYLAKKINPNYITLIIPARWYAGGKGLDSFRKDMLNDNSIFSLHDFANSKECFDTAEIAGGICYFLSKKTYSGPCRIFNCYNNCIVSEQRKLNKYKVLVRDNTAIHIIEKIKNKSKLFFNTKVFSRNVFALQSKERGHLSKGKDDFKLLSSNGMSYINKNDVQNINLALEYNVIVTYAMSGGNKPSKDGSYQILSSLNVLAPKEVCTETYLVIDTFSNTKEANKLILYLSTKFARFLLLQALTSIHITKASFVFVPLQDFTENSDIDWTKPVEDIDSQLYSKYGLGLDEIAFIESKIKPMQ